MLESLRGLGYSTASALADIIDNSISAKAKLVEISFSWSEKSSHITIIDDGLGMTDFELEAAMALGERNPLDVRAAHDLGRFGMGLKTASFSQCKRLTVASKVKGVSSCLRWDLEVLKAKPEMGWSLIEGPASGSELLLSKLDGRDRGTLVIWELLDRIVTDGFTADDFLNLIEEGVERHLAMVFHRFLHGKTPKLRLNLNGKKIEPWDPFMIGHPGKPWTSPIQRHHTAFGEVEVQSHVLPHRDRMTEKEYEFNGGPGGWTSQQGFYVYRNERLLLPGGWLGLGPNRAWNREETHRLARIRLDIPNTADAEWKIDVKKSTARPPSALRPWLTKIANDTRERARQVFAHRGASTSLVRGSPIELAWRTDRTLKGIRYRIDEEHPSVAAVLDNASPELKELIIGMMKVIEETVPVQKIWLDTAEQKETPRTGFATSAPEAVIAVMKTLLKDMIVRKGHSLAEAKKMLERIEPFHNYPILIESLSYPDSN